jgi:hypothetical protein
MANSWYLQGEKIIIESFLVGETQQTRTFAQAEDEFSQCWPVPSNSKRSYIWLLIELQSSAFSRKNWLELTLKFWPSQKANWEHLIIENMVKRISDAMVEVFFQGLHFGVWYLGVGLISQILHFPYTVRRYPDDKLARPPWGSEIHLKKWNFHFGDSSKASSKCIIATASWRWTWRPSNPSSNNSSRSKARDGTRGKTYCALPAA